MSIVRDDCNERQTRVDLMIDEFRKAQSRRLANASTMKDDAQVAEFARVAHGRAAIAGSASTPTRTDNGGRS
jgi:hypothetical protein